MADRVRVTFYLPVTRISDRTAYLLVLDHIRSLRPRDGVPSGELVIRGYTVSTDDPVVFGGLWWSERRHDWLRDDIVLLILDFGAGDYDRDKVMGLKRRIQSIYTGENAVQEELYVTVEEISLL